MDRGHVVVHVYHYGDSVGPQHGDHLCLQRVRWALDHEYVSVRWHAYRLENFLSLVVELGGGHETGLPVLAWRQDLHAITGLLEDHRRPDQSVKPTPLHVRRNHINLHMRQYART